MILVRKYQSRILAAKVSLLLFMSVVASSFAAGDLEIQVRLNATFKSRTLTNEHEVTARCILGTNDWYISGDFMRDGKAEYWLIGTNVFERRTVTSSMYLQRVKDFISEKMGTKPPVRFSYPHKGQVYTRTNSWLEPFGYGMERAVWLAFCSGSFLHTADRQIPLPLGFFGQSKGYSDKTVLLEDYSDLSPPKTVDLFTTNGTLACHYEVLNSTNVAGRTLPVQFRLIQYGDGQRVGPNTSQNILLGRVLSIKPCEAPPAPDIKSTP